MPEESKVQNCLASCLASSVHRDCQDEGWLLSLGAGCGPMSESVHGPGLMSESVHGPDLVRPDQEKE